MKLSKYACIVASLGFAVSYGAIGCGGDSDDDGPGGKGGTAGKSGGKGGTAGKSGGSGGGGTAGKSGGSGGSTGGSGGSTGGSGGSTGGSGGTPPMADGLIAYWKFDGNTMDSSGKGNHGTSVKGNTEEATASPAKFLEAGKKGKALDLSGNPVIDDAGATPWEWVKVPSSDSINETGTTGSFSITTWVKATGFDDTADDFNFVISRHELGTAHEHFGLGLFGGAPSVAVHFFFATGATAVSRGEAATWHHLAATYDGIDQAVYLDGEPASSASIGWQIAADSTHTVIGGNQNIQNVKEGFSGYIDELRLYSDALTPQQVKAEMAK